MNFLQAKIWLFERVSVTVEGGDLKAYDQTAISKTALREYKKANLMFGAWVSWGNMLLRAAFPRLSKRKYKKKGVNDIRST